MLRKIPQFMTEKSYFAFVQEEYNRGKLNMRQVTFLLERAHLEFNLDEIVQGYIKDDNIRDIQIPLSSSRQNNPRTGTDDSK